MKRIVRLTESDLARIVKRVISEAETPFAKYGDFITFENAADMAGSGGEKVYASLGSTVTPTKVPTGVGNLVTVNADVYLNKDGSWISRGKEKVTFVQICGAKANHMIKGNEYMSDTPGWVSKPGGAIQQKLAASCKTQGYKGQIQSPQNQRFS
jgi:hypothetical protein